MVDMNEVVARIVRQRAVTPERRSLLVGLSGIDGSGKGFVAKQIEARLAQHSIAAANINVDGWLNLPDRRFNSTGPAEHFYENAIRLDELFAKLLLPLREQRTLNLVANFAEGETAKSYRQRTYSFKNVGVVLVEGIFLFKREQRKLFDLAIWVDCSFPTALSRALARAQEGFRSRPIRVATIAGFSISRSLPATWTKPTRGCVGTKSSMRLPGRSDCPIGTRMRAASRRSTFTIPTVTTWKSFSFPLERAT